MKTSFNAAERENKSVNELASLIGYILKESNIVSDLPPEMLKHLYGEDTPHLQEAFFRNFYEAIALLERRGLIVYYMTLQRLGNRGSPFYAHRLMLTSVGRETDFRDEIFILGDAQEIVSSLKKEIPNLDVVVDQCYQDSIRACQAGAYNPSSLSLGAASERAIELLIQKVRKKYPGHAAKLPPTMSAYHRIEYLEKHFKNIFNSIGDKSFKDDLRERLSGFAHMYRRNRNEAGHPRDTPLDVALDEQVCYLKSFRRYAKTIFQAIELLDPNP